MAMPSALSAIGGWAAVIALALEPSLAVAASASDYFVRNLPGVPKDEPPIKMHAGHIEITPEHNGNLFFWHFQNRHIADRQRTVIWLNGGPGCSSEDGALMEIGPYRVKDDNTLAMNDGAWNEYANLLFVDNPVGTGFSYVDTDSYIHDLDTMAANFITFLDKFFELFPEYDQDDIYIAGESYAGQYIPYVANAILERNKSPGYTPWNLKGLLIGNGWISAPEQYDSYIPFAVEAGLTTEGSDVIRQLDSDVRKCQDVLATNPGKVDYSACEAIVSDMLRALRSGHGENECINMYDVRLRDSYPSCGMSWPPDLDAVTSYLRTNDVVRALHVNSQKNTGWQECKSAVGRAFTAKGSKPSVELLPGILEQVPVLLFSGDKDLLCNHIGTERLIGNLTWNGAQGFETSEDPAPQRAWHFEGEKAGYWQDARNLTYVLFYESSHMVPVDWPRRSRDMLDRFMQVDIKSVGGVPFDSQIDGEPNLSNGTFMRPSHEDTQKQLDDAKWAAYQNSGGAVLIIVIIVVAVWGFAVWRGRRKQPAYQALSGNENRDETSGLDGFRRKRGEGDLEAAAFDESELDDLHLETPTQGNSKYSVGEDSDDEDESKTKTEQENQH